MGLILIMGGLLLTVLIAVFFCCVKISNINKKNRQLEYDLYHDPVTGHTNWAWLWERIGHTADQQELPYDFVHFDIKDFKMFNELYNHGVGNEVLCYVSKKILEQDFILYSARCHNDNFSIVTDPSFTGDIEEKLYQFFDSMKYIPGYEERPVYFRCGVVEKNKKMRAHDTVADMAKMAQSRGQKVNCNEVIFYDEEMRETLIKGEKLKNELPEAFLRDEILIYFQPKINPDTEEIIGAEALARWNYHGKEIWPPYKFIPYLEQNNSINILDEYVVELVCRSLKKWKEEGKKLFPVSINLSQAEIYKETLVDDLAKIADKYEVDHGLIEFELTETAAYEDRDYLLRVMHMLRDKGFKLSMDDFGTGYSSFNLLKDMPINTLKIDKSFVDTVGVGNENTKGMKIVEDIIAMVKHLSLKCVAEGVEDSGQRDILKSWGCDYIQGYFYSKPISAQQYEDKYL